jgi:alkylation response protein AidB-like acyl-CoA dehydrogenase
MASAVLAGGRPGTCPPASRHRPIQWAGNRLAFGPMVDFTLTDENRLVAASVRAFAESEILPHIREWDEKGEVHREIFGRMGELGFLGAPIPEAYGGSGMDYVSFAILCE